MLLYIFETENSSHSLLFATTYYIHNNTGMNKFITSFVLCKRMGIHTTFTLHSTPSNTITAARSPIVSLHYHSEPSSCVRIQIFDERNSIIQSTHQKKKQGYDFAIFTNRGEIRTIRGEGILPCHLVQCDVDLYNESNYYRTNN